MALALRLFWNIGLTDKVLSKTLSVSELTPFLLFPYQLAN
jgi:hypothetical protein